MFFWGGHIQPRARCYLYVSLTPYAHSVVTCVSECSIMSSRTDDKENDFSQFTLKVAPQISSTQTLVRTVTFLVGLQLATKSRVPPAECGQITFPCVLSKQPGSSHGGGGVHVSHIPVHCVLQVGFHALLFYSFHYIPRSSTIVLQMKQKNSGIC